MPSGIHHGYFRGIDTVGAARYARIVVGTRNPTPYFIPVLPGLERQLQPGARVSFEITPGPRLSSPTFRIIEIVPLIEIEALAYLRGLPKAREADRPTIHTQYQPAVRGVVIGSIVEGHEVAGDIKGDVFIVRTEDDQKLYLPRRLVAIEELQQLRVFDKASSAFIWVTNLGMLSDDKTRSYCCTPAMTFVAWELLRHVEKKQYTEFANRGLRLKAAQPYETADLEISPSHRALVIEVEKTTYWRTPTFNVILVVASDDVSETAGIFSLRGRERIKGFRTQIQGISEKSSELDVLKAMIKHPPLAILDSVADEATTTNIRSQISSFEATDYFVWLSLYSARFATPQHLLPPGLKPSNDQIDFSVVGWVEIAGSNAFLCLPTSVFDTDFGGDVNNFARAHRRSIGKIHSLTIDEAQQFRRSHRSILA